MHEIFIVLAHRVGVVDNIAVREYMERMSPIMAKTDNRLTVLM